MVQQLGTLVQQVGVHAPSLHQSVPPPAITTPSCPTPSKISRAQLVDRSKKANALITQHIMATSKWDQAFSTFVHYSHVFNGINTSALIFHMAQLVDTQRRSGHVLSDSEAQEMRAALRELHDFAEAELPSMGPRELSNVAHGLSKLNMLSRRFVQLLVARVDPTQLKNQELSSLLWALAHAGQRPADTRWLQHMSDQVVSRRAELQHRELATSMWALAKLSCHPGISSLDLIVEELDVRAHLLLPIDFSNVLWALAVQRYSPSRPHVMEALLHAAVQHVSGIRPCNCSIMLWAVARGGWQLPAGWVGRLSLGMGRWLSSEVTSNHAAGGGMLQEGMLKAGGSGTVTDDAGQVVGPQQAQDGRAVAAGRWQPWASASSHDAAMALQAMAKLRHNPGTEVVDGLLALVIQSAWHASPQDLISSLWAAAHLGHSLGADQWVGVYAVSTVRVSEYSTSQVSCLVGSLARLKAAPPTSWVKAVCRHLLYWQEVWGPREVAHVMWGMARMHIQLSGRMVSLLLHTLLHPGQPHASATGGSSIGSSSNELLHAGQPRAGTAAAAHSATSGASSNGGTSSGTSSGSSSGASSNGGTSSGSITSGASSSSSISSRSSVPLPEYRLTPGGSRWADFTPGGGDDPPLRAQPGLGRVGSIVPLATGYMVARRVASVSGLMAIGSKAVAIADGIGLMAADSQGMASAAYGGLVSPDSGYQVGQPSICLPGTGGEGVHLHDNSQTGPLEQQSDALQPTEPSTRGVRAALHAPPARVSGNVPFHTDSDRSGIPASSPSPSSPPSSTSYPTSSPPPFPSPSSSSSSFSQLSQQPFPGQRHRSHRTSEHQGRLAPGQGSASWQPRNDPTARPASASDLLHHHLANALGAIPWLLPPRRRHTFGAYNSALLREAEHAALHLLVTARVAGARQAAQQQAAGVVGAGQAGQQQAAGVAGFANADAPRVGPAMAQQGAGQGVKEAVAAGAWQAGHQQATTDAWVAGSRAWGAAGGCELLQVAQGFAAVNHHPGAAWMHAHTAQVALAWEGLGPERQQRLVVCYLGMGGGAAVVALAGLLEPQQAQQVHVWLARLQDVGGEECLVAEEGLEAGVVGHTASDEEEQGVVGHTALDEDEEEGVGEEGVVDRALRIGDEEEIGKASSAGMEADEDGVMGQAAGLGDGEEGSVLGETAHPHITLSSILPYGRTGRPGQGATEQL